MAISTFKRYEKKYILTEQQYISLIPKLLNYMEPDKHCVGGMHYSIHNIYYDTLDNQVIRHSLSKPYYKEKLRLRSYGLVSSANEKVYLEIKKKIGGIVNKRRVEMTMKEATHFINSGIREKTNKYMKEQVLDEIGFFLKNNNVKPAVFIAYEREAYFGKENKDFRLTFDKNIITRRDNVTLTGGYFGEQLLEKDQRLMEIKILDAIPVWLANILSELEIYSTSFSKYGVEYKHYLLQDVKISELEEEKIVW